MALEFLRSPFISFSNGNHGQPSIGDLLRVEPSLDLLVQSTLGALYWNKSIATIGLVCGAAVSLYSGHSADVMLAVALGAWHCARRNSPYIPWTTLTHLKTNETNSVVRRLMASHMSDPMAQVLVLHKDHFHIKSTYCPLLFPVLPRPRILVSPLASDSLTKLYGTCAGLVTPVAFKATSVTLRHVLDFFTPSPGTDGHASIFGTVQLILSQLREPFDLQRFIEMVDQEKWSEEGANFMALRETLLTRLLSPDSEESRENSLWRMTVVDLTDPVLRSTGLDSSIMDVALHDFVQGPGVRKLIVFNNFHQYLTSSCSLSKTLETLVSVVGNDRPASIILSTTDPTVISFPILNTFDYVVSALSRSFQWNAFLQKHFTKSDIPSPQTKTGRAMIWSPESIMHRPDASTGDSKPKERWRHRISFIDIEQFEKTTPLNLFVNETLDGSGPETLTGNPKREIETVPPDTNADAYEDEEEGIVALDRPMTEEKTGSITNEMDVALTSSISTNAQPHHPSPPPAASIDAASPQRPTSAQTITAASCPPQHRAVIATLITLTGGTPRKSVRMDEWMSSLKCEYPGAREEFLMSLIAKAEEDGVMTRARDQDRVQWVWLNLEKMIRETARKSVLTRRAT